MSSSADGANDPDGAAAGDLAQQPQKRARRSTGSSLYSPSSLPDEKRERYAESVRGTLLLFHSLKMSFGSQKEKKVVTLGGKGDARGAQKAASEMNRMGLYSHERMKLYGSVPGIVEGDVFVLRAEMSLVGLHYHRTELIDFLSKPMGGEPTAVSLITSDGDKTVDGGLESDGQYLWYTGVGNKDKKGNRVCNQELKDGNLALHMGKYNDIPVRVIKSFKIDGKVAYYYAGLYEILDYKKDSFGGFEVLRFKLSKVGYPDDQDETGSSVATFLQAQLTKRNELIDLSRTDERVAVSLWNKEDFSLMPFNKYTYISKTKIDIVSTREGCRCLHGCTPELSCACMTRNGGELPFDRNGLLIAEKPIIFECGPNCTCPPNCRNRVAQRGLSRRLEVFKQTADREWWGLRALELIPAGSFVCEFAGVIAPQMDEDKTEEGISRWRVNPNFLPSTSGWGNICNYNPTIAKPQERATDLTFVLDVSTTRNLAAFIQHAAHPNCMVQFVLHDHDDEKLPRMMIFAIQNIPPQGQLWLDYGKNKHPNEEEVV